MAPDASTTPPPGPIDHDDNSPGRVGGTQAPATTRAT
jgi:hypothetical protein